MKKRLLISIFAIALACIFAAGCGKKEDSENTTAETIAITENNNEESEVAATEETTAAQNTPGDADGAIVDIGDSDIYSSADLEDAVSVIKDDFASWKGCVLNSLSYAGDDCNNEDNLYWVNTVGSRSDYTEVAEFLGDFRSPKEGGMWDPDKEYKDYQWWLARTDGGAWDLVISNQDETHSGSSTGSDQTGGTNKKDDAATQLAGGLTVVPVEGTMYCTAEDGVNLRAGCSSDDMIIGMIPYGVKVDVTGDVEKDGASYGWNRVNFNGQTGYVVSEFLDVKQPSADR